MSEQHAVTTIDLAPAMNGLAVESIVLLHTLSEKFDDKAMSEADELGLQVSALMAKHTNFVAFAVLSNILAQVIEQIDEGLEVPMVLSMKETIEDPAQDNKAAAS